MYADVSQEVFDGLMSSDSHGEYLACNVKNNYVTTRVKMSKIAVLKQTGALEAVRQALGVDEDDTSKDDLIEILSSSRILELYSQWELGDAGWAVEFIEIYKGLENTKI